jgi:hypothetical protein
MTDEQLFLELKEVWRGKSIDGYPVSFDVKLLPENIDFATASGTGPGETFEPDANVIETRAVT